MYFVTADRSLVDKTPIVLGPLTADSKPATDLKDSKTQQPSGPFVYRFSHWAR